MDRRQLLQCPVNYLDENGVYVTGTRKIDGKTQQFQSNGKWIGEIPVSRGFEKGKYRRKTVS